MYSCRCPSLVYMIQIKLSSAVLAKHVTSCNKSTLSRLSQTAAEHPGAKSQNRSKVGQASKDGCTEVAFLSSCMVSAVARDSLAYQERNLFQGAVHRSSFHLQDAGSQLSHLGHHKLKFHAAPVPVACNGRLSASIQEICLALMPLLRPSAAAGGSVCQSSKCIGIVEGR